MRCSTVVFLVTTLALVSSFPIEDSEIITKPRPGEEYVFVQSVSGSRPISRKEKHTPTADTGFETSHKTPSHYLERYTNLDKEDEGEENEFSQKNFKREALDTPHPGAIKIDASKLIEKYRDILESTTKKSEVSSTTPQILLTTGGPSTKRSFDIVPVNKEEKETGIEGKESDAKLSSSSSDRKTSRIQIKKGPNGQDYEYEYVYYYYDDENEGTPNEVKKDEKISNAHDGPAKNTITDRDSVKNKYTTIDRTGATSNSESTNNEIIPSSKGQPQRGRHVSVSEEVSISEERLPPNTRFPPRSRILSTTPVTEEEDVKATRTRQRGKPQETISEEAPGRSRNRSPALRPSLVDSASFKTHASDVSVSQFKELPVRGSSRFTDDGTATNRPDTATATSRSFDTSEVPSAQSIHSESDKSSLSSTEISTTENVLTTTLSSEEISAAMDKVALDLYAILQGTQNMMQESDLKETSTENIDSTVSTTDGTTEDSTGSTTELSTEQTPSTSTTQKTTTTTTPEPTSTTLTGRGRYRNRGTPNTNRFRTAGSQSSTESSAPAEPTSPKTRYTPHRANSFGGRNRISSRVTTEKGVEAEIVKEEEAPVSHARPSIGTRSRFGTRGRSSTTTAAPADNNQQSVSKSPSLTRPRPNFNLRRRGGPTTAADASSTTPKTVENHDEEISTEQPEVSSTTARPTRPRIGGGNVRPLRPGPKINIQQRGRIGGSTTTQAPPPVVEDNEESSNEQVPHSEPETSNSETTPTPVATSSESALSRLRNRARLTINPNKPKTSVPTPVPRRNNPLLGKRKPIGASESTTENHQNLEETSEVDKAQSEASTETSKVSSEDNFAEQSEESQVSSTTEPEHPRGLNSLLAGRRRITNRRPGTIL